MRGCGGIAAAVIAVSAFLQPAAPRPRARDLGIAPGAVFVGNAFGKLAGSTQVQELGTIETPINLTNTLSVGTGTIAFGWTGGAREPRHGRSASSCRATTAARA